MSTIPDSAPALSNAPIHNFASTVRRFREGDTVRVGDVVQLAYRYILEILPRVKPTEIPTKPSSHAQARNYTHTPFESPPFYLTQAVLDTPIVVSQLLHLALGILETSPPFVKIGEDIVTTRVVLPLVNVFRCIFEARLPPNDQTTYVVSRLWVDVDERFSMGVDKLELDVALQRSKPASPGSDSEKSIEVEFAMEMKTPKATNHSDMVALPTLSGLKSETTSQIISQVGKHGKYLAHVHPEKRFMIHALSAAPGHLFPCVSNRSKSRKYALGSDIVGLTDPFPQALLHEQRSHNWLAYLDKVGAFLFVVLYENDPRMRDAWGAGYEEQVQQGVKLLENAGKALQPTPAQVALDFVRTLLIAIQQLVSFPVLLLLTQLRSLSLVKTLKQTDTYPITLDPTFSWRPSFGLTLFPPCRTHETVENIVYIYASPPIVIKLFSKEETYRNELACYERLSDLQGRGIPVVLSTGVCEADGRRCLVLSHEGDQVHDLSDNDKAALQPVIDAIHAKALHHHDLHERNVVRDSEGRLRIIDFGYTGPCDDPLCRDGWKASWAS